LARTDSSPFGNKLTKAMYFVSSAFPCRFAKAAVSRAGMRPPKPRSNARFAESTKDYGNGGYCVPHGPYGRG